MAKRLAVEPCGGGRVSVGRRAKGSGDRSRVAVNYLTRRVRCNSELGVCFFVGARCRASAYYKNMNALKARLQLINKIFL